MRRDRYARSESEPSEGPLLAASRNASTQYELRRQHRPAAHLLSPRSRSPSRSRTSSRCRPRASTGCSATRLEGPGRGGARTPASDVPTKSGLEEIFEEISPIEDFSGIDVADVPRPPVRAAEVLHRRVQGARLHLLRPAVRHRRVHEQRDRRDQEPDRLHGRLPADDRQGHLHHQRHRACRRLAAGPLAGRLLRAHRRQDVRQGPLLRQGHPVPWCLARVRDRQARHRRRPHRPQAQADRHRAAQGARLDQRADPRGVRRVRVDARDAGEGPHHHARTRRCSTSTASCARASRPRARPRRRCSTTSTSTPSATTSPRSAATRSTRSSALDQPLDARRAHPRRHRRDASSTSSRLHAGETEHGRRRRAVALASRSTTSTTSATAACAPSASSSRTRSAPAWPAWSASSASA